MKPLLFLFLFFAFSIYSCQNTTYQSLAPIEKTKLLLLDDYTEWSEESSKLNDIITDDFDKEKAQNQF